MAWSTRELAELAGTTVNTVRHYHRLGLLEEPERRHNGYKQYEVPDLVRLLRIRRLADLGVPLAQIGQLASGGEAAADTLRALDAELAASVLRLQKARADIAAILRDGAPADVPAGFAPVASRLSETDSAMIHIYTRLYDDDAVADVRAMVAQDGDAVGRAIDALPADADETTRQELAERLAPALTQHLLDYPWLSDPGPRLAQSPHVTAHTFVAALTELYNPAQLDVLHRASALAGARLAHAREADGAAP